TRRPSRSRALAAFERRGSRSRRGWRRGPSRTRLRLRLDVLANPGPPPGALAAGVRLCELRERGDDRLALLRRRLGRDLVLHARRDWRNGARRRGALVVRWQG